VLVPQPADRRSICFEHRVAEFQKRYDGKLHQLHSCVDEQMDEGRMVLSG
jgi:hypothetical protein